MTLAVIVGPSGSGKYTLASNLRGLGMGIKPLPSYTTRLVRQSEAQHRGELIQVSDAEFDTMKVRDEFVWTVQPYKRPSRYGTRGSDLMDALHSRNISIAILTGDAPSFLYGYTVGSGQVGQVAYFYLHIEDYDELRRRLTQDETRLDIEDRLAAAHWENRGFKDTLVPYYTLDASKSEGYVLETALSVLKLNKLLP